MRFAWRTNTMVLSDHKVAITELPQGCYTNSKGITEGGTTRSSPKSHIILRKNKRELKFIALRAIMTESSQFSIVNNSFSLSCNPFFEIWICKSLSVRIQHPAKNTNELGTAWQNIAGNRHIHEQKESHL